MASLLPVLEVLQESISAGRTPAAIDFANLGKAAWVLSFCGLMVVIFGAMAAKRIGSGESEQRALVRATIDVSLFWGVCAAALGVFSTVMSLILMATSMLAVDRVDLFLVLSGVRLSLAATALGLLIFLASALLWLGLRRCHRKAVVGGT